MPPPMQVTQRLGTYTLIVSGVGELSNTSVTIPSAGVEGDVRITMGTIHEVESTGKILIKETFPLVLFISLCSADTYASYAPLPRVPYGP